MTNPDNIVRVRARNGGRASVYEANGWAQGFTSGLLEGNGVIQNTSADMNVLVGGSTSKPDVVLAENPSGYRIALDLVGQQAIAITAPATNSRISAIVAYTDDLSLQSTEDTITGSPASCGLIVVNGTAGATPSEPTEAQIRTAITADGATGSQACYCVIATIQVESTTTVITNSLITMNNCGLAKSGIVKANNIDFTTSEITTVTPSSSISATFHPDWYRKELGDGIVKYWLDFSFTVNTGGVTWSGDRSVALPVTFDASKMAVSVSANADDAAIITTPSFRNNYFSINRYNAFNESINTTIHVQAEITVFS